MPRLQKSHIHRPPAQPGEAAKLIAVSPAWLRAYILLGAQTGLRRADLLAISEAHIDKGLITMIMQKTKLPVSIPVSPELLALVATLPPGDATTPIVARIAGKPVGKAMLAKAWCTARRTAGINPKLTSHGLRHAIALAAYEDGKDVLIVQQLLGHANMRSTIDYLEHWDPAKLKPLLEKLWTPKGAQ